MPVLDLQPQEMFFALRPDKEGVVWYVVLVPIRYWNDHRHGFDHELTGRIAGFPEWEEVSESVFLIPANMLIRDAEDILRSLGCQENIRIHPEAVSLGPPPPPSRDDTQDTRAIDRLLGEDPFDDQ